MIVVSDTSCLSNLLTVGHVHLLAQLFGEIIVPPAVEEELKRFHPTIPEFVKCVTPQNVSFLARLRTELHRGEAEAICLARELNADRLLIDEKRGREVALREGIAIIGIVGVLVSSKQKGHLSSVTHVLEQLESQA